MSSSIAFKDLNENKKGCGMVFWMEWHLTKDAKISDGPVNPIVIGEKVQWYKHSKQGVHFFIESKRHSNAVLEDINVKVSFDPKEGSLSFAFS